MNVVCFASPLLDAAVMICFSLIGNWGKIQIIIEPMTRETGIMLSIHCWNSANSRFRPYKEVMKCTNIDVCKSSLKPLSAVEKFSFFWLCGSWYYRKEMCKQRKEWIPLNISKTWMQINALQSSQESENWKEAGFHSETIICSKPQQSATVNYFQKQNPKLLNSPPVPWLKTSLRVCG